MVLISVMMKTGYIRASRWTAERSEFESRYNQGFSLLHFAQTGSGANSVSYSMGTGSSFPWGEVAGV
jgi:hypothetical protein